MEIHLYKFFSCFSPMKNINEPARAKPLPPDCGKICVSSRALFNLGITDEKMTYGGCNFSGRLRKHRDESYRTINNRKEEESWETGKYRIPVIHLCSVCPLNQVWKKCTGASSAAYRVHR